MDFINSTPGLVILMYFAIGMVLAKTIERKDDVSFTFVAYIICMFTWLPFLLWGMLDGLRGKPPP